MDLDALVAKFGPLQVAQRVAAEQHFLHWELEFADIFNTRDGFDLVLGNPPWIKIEWNEQALLSDFDPRFSIRKLSAKETGDQREAAFASLSGARAEYLDECVAIDGLAAFLNAAQNYPLLKGIQSNLYKCFLPIVWRVRSGVHALLHPEGPYDDPKGGALRAAIYPRLRAHYQFANELILFAEVDHHAKFSINIYGKARPSVQFRHIANVFAPVTIHDSLINIGGGSTPGIKRDEGGWNTAGHANRIIKVDGTVLSTFASLYDPLGTPPSRARLPAIHSTELLSVVQRMSSSEHRFGSITGREVFTSEGWHEGSAQKNQWISRESSFPDTLEETVLSGPHIWSGIPLYKAPRRDFSWRSDYDVVPVDAISDSFRPRTNFRFGASKKAALDRLSSQKLEDQSASSYYRLATRRGANPANERSLIAAVIPPGVTHVDSIYSVAFSTDGRMLQQVGL